MLAYLSCSCFSRFCSKWYYSDNSALPSLWPSFPASMYQCPRWSKRGPQRNSCLSLEDLDRPEQISSNTLRTLNTRQSSVTTFSDALVSEWKQIFCTRMASASLAAGYHSLITATLLNIHSNALFMLSHTNTYCTTVYTVRICPIVYTPYSCPGVYSVYVY